MLSRVADNLYWFGRYLQRAENTARLINVNSLLLLDLPRGVRLGWEPLIQIVGAGATFYDLYEAPSEEHVTRFLAVDERNPGSIRSSLHCAREALRTTRDCMPGDMWEKLNDLYFYVQDQGDRSLARARRLGFLDHVIDGALLMYGLLMANMSHDVGFRLLRTGASLEQADMTTRIVDASSIRLIRTTSNGPAADKGLAGPLPDGSLQAANSEWLSVLRSLKASQMYRRHVHVRVSRIPVVRFLLQNEEFPRSVLSCLRVIGATLSHLPRHPPIDLALAHTHSLVEQADIDSAVGAGLHQLMDDIQKGLGELHEAISRAFFGGSDGQGQEQ
jgi:uncharacterized alpha-E superfamily protein